MVRAKANDLLPGRCTVATLPRDAVRAAYRASDAFVLASLREGFGLAQVEALDAGLPCVVHDTPTTAYIVGGQGIRAKLDQPGALAPALERALRDGSAQAQARHDHAYARFSWDVLAPAYAQMLLDCAAGRRPAGVAP